MYIDCYIISEPPKFYALTREGGHSPCVSVVGYLIYANSTSQNSQGNISSLFQYFCTKFETYVYCYIISEPPKFDAMIREGGHSTSVSVVGVWINVIHFIFWVRRSTSWGARKLLERCRKRCGRIMYVFVHRNPMVTQSVPKVRTEVRLSQQKLPIEKFGGKAWRTKIADRFNQAIF